MSNVLAVEQWQPFTYGLHSVTALRHRDLVRYAELILRTIEENRTHLGLNEAIGATREQLVDSENDPELRALGELLVRARALAVTQNQLDEDRRLLHAHHLQHDELVQVGHHYEMLRQEACDYNHHLRRFIEAHQGTISRRELSDWLVTASQGRHEWVEGEITGATSEVALHTALVGMPELTGVRFATVEEDLRGYDFIAQWQGQLITIDAKTGYYRPLSERKHGHRHLEISVPREELDGFRLTRHGLDLLRRETRKALLAGTGAYYHGSHHWNRHRRR